MRLAAIRLTNVGIIQHLEIPTLPRPGEPGVVVRVRGQNGQGKTTILNALSGVFDGGSRPEMIGPNGDKCRVELEFDNGAKFVRTETSKGYQLTGISADGAKISSPAKVLQSWASGIALNPTGLIDAPAKDRVKFLQDAMPIRFTGGEVADAAGETPFTYPPDVDLAKWQSIREGKYEKRREANVRVEQLRATRKTFSEALPDGDVLRYAKAGSTDTETPTVEREAVTEIQRRLSEAQAQFSAVLAQWRNGLDEARGEIRHKEAEELEAVREKYRARQVELDALYEFQVAVSRKPLEEQIAQIAGELGEARQRAEQETKLAGVRESIARLDGQIAEMEMLASRLDGAVKALDELKATKLAQQPLPGVETTKDGRILYNGLDFDTQLNTAQQYLLSCQVASLAFAEDSLRLMIIDRAESLDDENKEAFIEGIKAAGFQLIMAEVATGEPLKVQLV